MKSVFKSLIMLVACITFFTSCNKCSETLDPRTTEFLTIKVVDSIGINLVNETSGPYYPDSIKVTSIGNSDFYFKKLLGPEVNDIKFQLLPPFSNEGETYLLLYLNKNDSDTLVINYTFHQEKCGNYYEYTRLRYNGRDLTKTIPTDVLELVKK